MLLRRGLIKYLLLMKIAKLGHLSYYPDLLSVRSKPGVVSHLEHVIVAGGTKPTPEDDDTPVVQDDIEVLNWIAREFTLEESIH